MIKFVTLYAQDIDKTVAVYQALGLSFVKEQHGAGPVHWACERDGDVLEIYPGLEGPGRSVLMGFEVADLSDAKRALAAAGAVIVKDVADIGGVSRLVAQDPDGRELFVQLRREAG